jgi:hypothetical protein
MIKKRIVFATGMGSINVLLCGDDMRIGASTTCCAIVFNDDVEGVSMLTYQGNRIRIWIGLDPVGDRWR